MRPRQLWQLDMSSVWVAEHGWCYLNAIIDCCTREIVAWQLELRCRADEAIALIEHAAAVLVACDPDDFADQDSVGADDIPALLDLQPRDRISHAETALDQRAELQRARAAKLSKLDDRQG